MVRRLNSHVVVVSSFCNVKLLFRCCWHLWMRSQRGELLTSHLWRRRWSANWWDEKKWNLQLRSKFRHPVSQPVTSGDIMDTHLQYHPWCNICVRARGRENRHVSRSQNQPGTPVIQCDYCFLKTEEDAPMVTVLVAIDTVYKQMVKKLSIRKSQSRRIRTVRRTSQSDHPRRLGARTHGSHPRRMRIADSRNTTHLTCEQQGLKWNATWLLSHFQTGSADGKTAYARQFERPYESPVLPFAERVMRKDPTLQPAKLNYGLWLGRSQISNAHLIGTRVGIVVARTIRRLPASEREDSNLVVAMRGTPVAGRPAAAAAGDVPTVTRHAVKLEKWSWFSRALAPHCKRAAAKASAHLQIQFQIFLSRQLRGHSHHRLQWKAAIIQVVRELTVLVLVVTCLWRWHKLWNRQRNYTLQWRSTMRVSFQRDREGDP